MSAIAGVYNRHETADSQLLHRLSGALRPMGPDGEGFEFATQVGMAHRPFFVDHDSRLDSQPVVDARGFLLVWDGRLDNRSELRQALGSDLQHPAVDSAIVLAAFHCWGPGAFARLIGDFALSIWDAKEEKLYLAVDSLGLRALYYNADGSRVIWASRARALLSAADLSVEIDDEYVAAFMANSISEHSPYQGIRQIPGGHMLIVDRDTVTLERYWGFDPEKEIRYSSDEQYAEHFRELFLEAVACRLRSDRPLFAELSGGVDSSSIVCTVDHLRSGGGSSIPELFTVSYVFEGATSSDERPYIREVEQQRGQTGLHMLEEEFPILSKRPPAGFAPDLPTNQISYLARYDHVSQLMEEQGSRVLLSGIGGDQAFISELPDQAISLADLLVERRFREMFRSCYRWSRWFRTPYFKTLWLGAVVPLLPFSWQARRKGALPVGEWLGRDFVERMDLRRRGLGPGDDLGFRLPTRALQNSWLRQTMRPFALAKCVSHGHFEVRYPYLDRRLLEFAMAIPFEQKFRLGESRSVVRRGLRGIVPRSVLERRSKAGPAEAFQRAIVRERQWLSELFYDSVSARLGFIDGPAFQASLNRASHGLISHPAQMHRTISLELWLRTLQPGRSGLESEAGAHRQAPPYRRLTLTKGVNHA